MPDGWYATRYGQYTLKKRNEHRSRRRTERVALLKGEDIHQKIYKPWLD